MSSDAGLLATDEPAARAVYERALRDLGSDLDGGSLVDLLADNFAWPLAYCRAMAERLNPSPPICHNADCHNADCIEVLT